MSFLSESDVETLLLERFKVLCYQHLSDAVIGPEGSAPERESYGNVILMRRLRKAVDRLNPDLPEEARTEAIKRVVSSELPNLVEENRRIHALLVDGVPVEYRNADGEIRGGRVRLIDFDDPEANDWLVVDQLTVVESGHNRRPDVVVYLNGLPVAVIELKNPGNENATIWSAYNQLQTYKSQIPSLFRTNAALIISDGLTARIGSLTSNEERFMPWRTTDGASEDTSGLELPILTEGVFDRERFLRLLRDFVVFMDGGSGLVKVLAGYHQFHAVQKAIEKTVAATRPQGDRKVGVVWHTQGSGKSLLMAFYAGQLVKHPALENPTIVVITDRNDLDDQLYQTFAQCSELIRQTPQQANSRADLQKALTRVSGGVVFTTIQKFAPEQSEDQVPVLTDRRNVIVIADEAHRSQYGFRATIDRKTGKRTYGFAKHLRDALPNASFIGFTGTPIEQDDVNTPVVFGHYIDVYDITRAVQDGATVPIYYESRLARIDLPDSQKPVIDEEIAELVGEEGISEQERLKRKWSTVEALVGAEKRLQMVAKDIVEHFEARTEALPGKGMIVTMSRRIGVRMYEEIIKLRPEWHSDDDVKGRIKVVMTGSASDPHEWQHHIGNNARRDLLAKRMKDPSDPLELVIVRDMWLTGFDVPSLHTMYVDKPMRGHGLMQAIARVNRVFMDKQAGLVVDYIGIAQNLKEALGNYSKSDRDKAGIDQAEAIAVMLDKYDIVKTMFHGFDYDCALTGSNDERLLTLANAIDFIQAKQHAEAARETSDTAKKRAHRRYQDATLALSKAFSLGAASDEAKQIRDEVAFFEAVRGALGKTTIGTDRTTADRELAVRQLIDRAVSSTEIVDVLAAVGFERPDISILSESFLTELQNIKQKNLAVEALKKLLADEIRSRSASNIVEARKFSEQLENAIARYHTNAITTAEVIQELIRMAKDVAAAHARGAEEGLSPDEIAFYDALAANDSAVEVLGNDELKIIAHELLEKLRKNITVDWARRERARARLRVLVKDILEDHGYPPDLSKEAVQTVLAQAEVLSARWTSTAN
jgi:type I restriction enzyme R subunit